MSSTLDDRLASAHDALQRHAWNEAFELLSEADKSNPLSGSDLGALAEAAWWTGRADDTFVMRERAFNSYLSEGNEKRAAMMAMLLAEDYFRRQDTAQGGGWFMRAERMLEPLDESVEHGYLHQYRAMGAVGSGAFADALEESKLALDIGMRFDDKDLQAFSLAINGGAMISLGNVEEGLAVVDEATVAAVSGELSPMATGIVYCMTISICRDLADYRRAGEWTEAAKRWCERQSINGFPGVCRVHRAEIMALRGSWAEAEQEARRASDELARYNLSSFVAASNYEIGEIRMRMGDLSAAEESFRLAHELGRVPQPGLAMLWFIQGKTDAAASGIRRALGDELNPLMRARMLPAQIEIAISMGDLETARAAAEELTSIGERFGSPALHAAAHYARASVQLADGEIDEATKNARLAWKHFTMVEVPYEAARSRVLLGLISRAAGDEDDAQLEFQSASAAFRKLGAILDIKKIDELTGGDGSAGGSRGERVTRTFMFTDIVKSTNLIEVIGDEAWGDLLRWHDATMRSVIAEHTGQEIRHQGDGFFVAFERSADAVACAIHIQKTLVEHRRSQGFAPQVRIGLHLAEATKRGLDYAGRGIHEAARIGALAEGGEIAMSSDTYQRSESRLPVSETKSVNLKGITEPVEVVTLSWR